uniref:Signal recognition particle 9 kDa protein n=1 Tax=Propithecus coquereli TaxID=379532 RepID=A0A2K6EW80_PROCO
MPQYQTWEEFSCAAEKLYLADPMKARVALKCRHSDRSLCIKVTNDLKFHSQLMRLMQAKESCSVAMEAD